LQLSLGDLVKNGVKCLKPDYIADYLSKGRDISLDPYLLSEVKQAPSWPSCIEVTCHLPFPDFYLFHCTDLAQFVQELFKAIKQLIVLIAGGQQQKTMVW